MTQLQAAKELKTNQALVSRILSRRWKRKSAQIQKIADSLGVTASIDPRTSPELMQALAEVWNGDEEDARALAQCIRAIGEARKTSSF
ncbi:hypothetical protein EB809_19855 [Marinobacter sp. R17]|nr:hypothetical protein EB809_19855 [Marinobacter sp. R17]